MNQCNSPAHPLRHVFTDSWIFSSVGNLSLVVKPVPIDRSWKALQIRFWVRDDWTKHSNVNSREKWPAGKTQSGCSGPNIPRFFRFNQFVSSFNLQKLIRSICLRKEMKLREKEIDGKWICLPILAPPHSLPFFPLQSWRWKCKYYPSPWTR